MNILIPQTTSLQEVSPELDRIDEWNRTIPSKTSGQYDSVLKTFWIGNSNDGKTWALMFDDESSNGDDSQEHQEIVAVLIDPPKRNAHTIAEILLRVYTAANIEGANIENSTLNNIAQAVEFPRYRPVSDYLPLPLKNWGQIPCELVVGFELSEWACVVDSTFTEFTRDSFQDAMKVVGSPRHVGLLMHYSLLAREVTPFLSWDIDWPLMRRGKEKPVRREKVQGDFPWEEVADTSIACVYQHIANWGSIWAHGPPYYGEPVIRLRVGGTSPEDAVANWYSCAKYLRAILKSL